jgi:acetyl-CoA carboxylase/biotin carboxylase 1
VQASDLIARLDLDDPSSVRKAEPFHGTFPKLGPPTAISGKVHQKFAASMNSAHMILAGYEHNTEKVRQQTFLTIVVLPLLFLLVYLVAIVLVY